jgi:cell division protein FtsW (lipid II flippase)
MSAGRPNSVLSLLPPVGLSLPIVSTGLPSLVYLKMALSVSALPAIQTKP